MQVRVHTNTEDASVVHWRHERLAQAGFAQADARWLARDWRYDLHALIQLVEQGCEPRLAIRILAPLDERDAA